MIKKIALSIFAILGLILTFGSEGAYQSTFGLFEEEQPTLTLSHMSWDDSLSSTAVIANVLRDEGYEVNLVQLDPAFLFSSLANGESDFSVSPWLPITHQSYIDEYGDQLDVLGPHVEGATISLAVPEYMGEGLDSIDDLTDEANQIVTGIEPGGGFSEMSNQVMEEYDNLSDWELVESSSGAMLTSLGQAIDNQEEIVITAWTPHWMFIEYDLKVLEDPLNIYGTAEDIATVARPGLAEDHPQAYQIIDNFYWELEDIQQVMLDLQEGMSPDAAATKWIDENPEKVAEWTEGTGE
jgi:glycine betaine/proline transport system substrate-binding protein